MVGQLYCLVMTEKMGRMHGMYGTTDAELEVHRTIKREELAAFFCLFRCVRYNAGWRGNGADQRQHGSAGKRGGVRGFTVCGQLSLFGGEVARLCRVQTKDKRKVNLRGPKMDAKKHSTEWCVATSRYRCMRCGRNCKKMKMPGKCEGARWLGRTSTTS